MRLQNLEPENSPDNPFKPTNGKGFATHLQLLERSESCGQKITYTTKGAQRVHPECKWQVSLPPKARCSVNGSRNHYDRLIVLLALVAHSHGEVP